MRHILRALPQRSLGTFITFIGVLAASTCTGSIFAQAAEPNAKGVAPGVAPGIAAGWPVVLRGAVTGVPVAADLDGDGRLEVVAPAMQREWDRGLASPAPTLEAQLWAFGADAEGVEGWPLTLKTVQEREAMRKEQGPGLSENWYVSPSVCDVDGDGASEIVMNSANNNWADPKQGNLAVIYGDGTRIAVGQGGDAWASIPLADVDGDGVLDVVMHHVLSNVRNQPLKGWPYEKRLRQAYQPAIGDADGDGRPELFVPFYDRDWHLPGQPENKTLGGFSPDGTPLPGWPRKLPSIALYVVMGDIAGDAQKEIIAVDRGQNLRAWNLDGTPVALHPDAQVPQAQLLVAGRLEPRAEDDVVLATRAGAFAPPCLADLDGDGKAEILFLGDNSSGVFAFRGDGRPFVTAARPADEPLPRMSMRDPKTGKPALLDPDKPEDRVRLEAFDASRRRGLVARLPFLNALAHCAVSAVDLGGDGEMDIFAGTHWIRLAKDGQVRITDMMQPTTDSVTTPAAPITNGRPRSVVRSQAQNDAGCSIADLEGDGQAEVIFGLSNGRLFVFRTGMSLKPRDAQWPTWSGNFQHTGVWTAAR